MSSCCGVSRGGDQGDGFVFKLPQTNTEAKAHVIWMDGGKTFVGTDHPEIGPDGEGPARKVVLKPYGLEAETVTNARFQAFVKATGYVTEAEKYGWSTVFHALGRHPELPPVSAELPWWRVVNGVSWQTPEGEGSSIEDRMDHPVIQVSWQDACAFAQWVGGRLPTEPEWEHAARGGSSVAKFPWGTAEPTDDEIYCNIWQGNFPHVNTARDGFERTAPSKSFAPNPLGFYNMAGNVWEWTADPFKIRSMSRYATARNAQAQAQSDKLLKGGSFLCHISYCYRYRVAARIGMSANSATSHAGFRVAYDPKP